MLIRARNQKRDAWRRSWVLSPILFKAGSKIFPEVPSPTIWLYIFRTKWGHQKALQEYHPPVQWGHSGEGGENTCFLCI